MITRGKGDLATRLAYWRRTVLDMSQEQFASETHIAISAIRKYETRVTQPNCQSLLSIAATGVNLHWLLTGEGGARSIPSEEDTPTCITDSAMPYTTTMVGAEDYARIQSIMGEIETLPSDAQNKLLNECASRIKEIKRILDLEKAMAELKNRLG